VLVENQEGEESVQVKISTRHGQISEETQQTIKDKTEKLLHIFSRLTMIEVTVDMKEEQKLVELKVSAEHSGPFVATESHKEVLTALDAAVAKLEGQLRKYKGKIQDHRRDPSASDVAGNPGQEEPDEE
jgi:putative sigma-54 modulation protein